MNLFFTLFVNFFTRNRTVAKRLGALSGALSHINHQRELLAEALRVAIEQGSQAELPEQVAHIGDGITLVVQFHPNDHHDRMTVLAQTTLTDPNYLLVEMIRQALANDIAHNGLGAREVLDGGRRGYLITVNGATHDLVDQYRASRWPKTSR
ncbi:MAG TPA: hypothetical protein VLA88_06170 [Candidatus Saccharimonadales bacterium]|nr:hypothetical protein [Candidatus Saccharimonadales bacterium]